MGFVDKTLLEEIWSGGQCGVDQVGLRVALDLGLITGGWMPKGWRCFIKDEDGVWIEGSRPEFARLGLKEDSSSGYANRTKKNVIQTDGTFWFGNRNSPGGKLTLNTASRKPTFIVSWVPGDSVPLHRVNGFRNWLRDNKIRKLNVAGNKESTSVGISEAAYQFLWEALGEDIGE